MASPSVLMLTLVLTWTNPLAVVEAQQGAQPAKPVHGEQRSGRAADSSRRPGKWWTDPKERAELGITDQQSATMEQIFQAVMPAQRERWGEFVKLEKALDKMIGEQADVATVTALVDRVETLRAEMAKARTMMLYRMHLEMSAEQRAKYILKYGPIQQRREPDRRRLSDAPRR